MLKPESEAPIQPEAVTEFTEKPDVLAEQVRDVLGGAAVSAFYKG